MAKLTDPHFSKLAKSLHLAKSPSETWIWPNHRIGNLTVTYSLYWLPTVIHNWTSIKLYAYTFSILSWYFLWTETWWVFAGVYALITAHSDTWMFCSHNDASKHQTSSGRFKHCFLVKYWLSVLWKWKSIVAFFSYTFACISTHYNRYLFQNNHTCIC